LKDTLCVLGGAPRSARPATPSGDLALWRIGEQTCLTSSISVLRAAAGAVALQSARTLRGERARGLEWAEGGRGLGRGLGFRVDGGVVGSSLLSKLAALARPGNSPDASLAFPSVAFQTASDRFRFAARLTLTLGARVCGNGRVSDQRVFNVSATFPSTFPLRLRCTCVCVCDRTELSGNFPDVSRSR